MNKDPENDPVWDLLGNASKQEANPMFSRDVMRSIRLDEQDSVSWWQRILRPAPIFGSLATAAACVALVFYTQTEQPSSPESIVAQQETSSDSFSEIADIFDASDDLDDLISPISLIASNDVDFQEFEDFLSY